MSQLLRMLDFITLSVLQEKLSPTALKRLIQSPGSWRLADVNNIFKPKDQLYKQYLKAYLRVAKTRRRLQSPRLKIVKSKSYQLPMPCRFHLVKRNRIVYLPPPIIRTSHPNAPRPFITIPPLIPTDFPPFYPMPFPLSHIPPDLRQIDKSIVFLKKECSSCCIPDRSRTRTEVSSYFNEVQNYSALSHSTTAPPASYSASYPTPPASYSASYPTPPPINYTDNVVASTYYSETFGYNPYPSYTTATTITPASLDPAPFPTPPPTNYTCDGIAPTCYSESSEYYSQPSYTTAPTYNYTPASYSVPTLTPSPTDYTSNGTVPTYYSHPSYNSVTTYNYTSASYSMPTLIPSSIDYTSNGITPTCYSESSEYYSQPSYTTAPTYNYTPASYSASNPAPSSIDYTSNEIASTPTFTPTPLDCIVNLVASTGYPENSGYYYPSHTIAPKMTPASYSASNPAPTSIDYTSNGIAPTRFIY